MSLADGMTDQLDLFAPPPSFYEPESAEQERLGWEERCLEDLAAGPVVACYPGFMGSVYERLVSKGLATREDAGFLDPEVANVSDEIRASKAFKAHIRAYWKDPFPQFRYSLTGL